MPTQPIKVAVLGAGTVGAAVARLLQDRSDRYAATLGRPLRLTGVAVRDLNRPRPGIDPDLRTDDAAALARSADLVVELMGGHEPARTLIAETLSRGAPVVTANKQLIARDGLQLQEVADANGAGLEFEAAVAGAVPVVSVVREALAGDDITAIRGILNGSTNSILGMVADQGMAFTDAVRRAGELGYLEADPSEDLDGLDAAAKIAILARLAWGQPIEMNEISIEGIRDLTDDRLAAASEVGMVIKLVATAELDPISGRPLVQVQPEPVPAGEPLGLTRGGDNTIEIETALAGTLRLTGAGAGGQATASAVLADILRAAARIAPVG